MAGKNQPLTGWAREDFNTSVQSILDGSMMALTFFRANLAASQDNLDLFYGAADNVFATMPFAGEVVGYSANLSANATGSELVVGVMIGGVEVESTEKSIAINGDTITNILSTPVTFNAGQYLSAYFATDGSWTGTTRDLAITIFVRFN